METRNPFRVYAGIMLAAILLYLLTRDMWADKIPEPIIQILPFVSLALLAYVLASIAGYFLSKHFRKR